jgi:hypothetical protein
MVQEDSHVITFKNVGTPSEAGSMSGEMHTAPSSPVGTELADHARTRELHREGGVSDDAQGEHHTEDELEALGRAL